ncbi:SpvB/TcaC N-terminal domain-containing protein [Massilia sp. YIM B04103]|uniref:SpvB/TcaC N-terminal domain-containing protein n=1 Tax=Massilia sp. YIM B04103 TaxID=2963106 RepID=UPI00210D1555|nr:SpvB/TcaC N-terminal domain-containing protein [Massilia sp. YIM B04103]
MTMPKQTETVKIAAPSLPKGGGAIQGMGEALGNVGMNGQASFSVPLPISPGRGYAPALTLGYGSDGGNGVVGMGWQIAALSISRRTAKGVPRYGDEDQFLAPSGEHMVPELDTQGRVVTTAVAHYGGLALGQSYTVTRYYPSVMAGFDRIERWQGEGEDFWLLHGVDGQLHCLGKRPASRIADPAAPIQKIASWLLDESVSPTGEHICYEYLSEDTAGVDMRGNEAQRTQTANRYLGRVQYGNTEAYAPLYAWGKAGVEQPRWLFTLIFDYGERSVDALRAPTWAPIQAWPCRLDSFSSYAYGFEVRTHRLCHQVLMFHHFPDELGQENTLVKRLLLAYAQTPVLSQLRTAQFLAYDDNGDSALPPLEFDYTAFDPAAATAGYQPLPAFAGLSDGVQYQLVDLYGEGLPGILYQAGTDWRYQAPQRGSAGPDAIGYSVWQSLPALPSLIPARKMLTDLTGDGRLDWLVSGPALAGYFTLNPNRRWSGFIPFPAFPVEFLQPSAQLADLVGDGLSDLALIGPDSVRLYRNLRSDGFGPPRDVAHEADNCLPVIGHDPAAFVGFSDVLGSGQQHLVYIRYNSLECWPNLGWGRFGAPLLLAALPFDAATFDPARIFLADLDGSGATDLIYAEADHFLIFLNQSGNGFNPVPWRLPTPPGLRYDRLDQVSFADMDGSGCADLVLSVSHMAPQHWYYRFAPVKPYLLRKVNNNMGGATELHYRSSVQEWLDEKQEKPDSVCQLPFAMPLLSATLSLDEVNGNTLTQQYLYRQGVYAGVDREFRGFGFVQHTDTSAMAAATASDVPMTAPAQTRVWYHTGQEGDELHPAVPPYADPALFALGPTRFSVFDSASGQDQPLLPADAAMRYQLYRALKGQVLRTEVYGADASPRNATPYSVQTSQYQVRLVQAGAGRYPDCVLFPMSQEQLSVSYDRIGADPQVQQSVTLQVDAFGAVTRSVAIAYARRPQPPSNPYPASVPDAQWRSTYDISQQQLRLTESLASVYNLDDPQVWRLGLPYQARSNAITDPSGYSGYPADKQGLDYAALNRPDGVLGAQQRRVFGGQSMTYYFNASGTAALPAGVAPPPLALVEHVDRAELDAVALAAYAGIPDLDARLERAGYRLQPEVLAQPGVPAAQVWVVPQGYTIYVDQDGNWLPFYRPRASQTTQIVGPQSLTYDRYTCCVLAVTDALGSQVRAEYDYRFLSPWQVTDANGNLQQALFDALGRVVAGSWLGHELAPDGQAVAVGFAPVSNFNAQAPELAGIPAALANPEGAVQQAASTSLYAPFSWMGRIDEAGLAAYSQASEDVAQLWAALQQAHLITADGFVLAHGRDWAAGQQSLPGIPAQLRPLLQAAERSPVHAAVLTPDQYPGVAGRQVQIQLSYSDGFGRALQACQQTVPGPAFMLDEQGRLVLENGQPVLGDTGTAPRWIVSGRVEYNNKGWAVRRYQPYFLDQPGYVTGTEAQQWGYADTLYYDPLGRVDAVVTALGYLRRTQYYPWFSVAEDENDTLSEVMNEQGRRALAEL